MQRPKLEDCVLREEHKDGTKVFNVRDTEPRMIISHGLPVTDNCLKAPSQTFWLKGIPAESETEQWKDFFETDETPAFDEALRLVQQGEPVFLQGFGGTGRTLQRRLSRGKWVNVLPQCQ